MEKSHSVLIVEDEAVTGMYFELLLKKRGFEISDIAATGEEAVDYASKFNPEVILMDIRLAGEIDGIEAAREIRSFSSSPIIFVTGYSDDTIKKRALQTPNSRYHVKPVEINELISDINSSLKERS